MEVGGAADLGGLTPPALSAPRPLPTSPPVLGFSVAMEGCCMHGRLELGGARRLPAAGTHACVCMHACAYTHTHAVGGTLGAMHLLAHFGLLGKSVLRARAHAHTARAHRRAHAHALWAHSGPCTVSLAQPGLEGKLEHGDCSQAQVHTVVAWPLTLCPCALHPLIAWLARSD